jgi:hypothetical protein
MIIIDVLVFVFVFVLVFWLLQVQYENGRVRGRKDYIEDLEWRIRNKK